MLDENFKIRGSKLIYMIFRALSVDISESASPIRNKSQNQNKQQKRKKKNKKKEKFFGIFECQLFQNLSN